MREVVHEADQGLVLEVAFEGLQRSTRHKSGLAMRFPRISRLRWDKPPREADRLETLERMLEKIETGRGPTCVQRRFAMARSDEPLIRMIACPSADERPMASRTVTRFLGGPPLAVLFRLILLSILVGVILSVLGLDPWNIIESIRRLFRRIWDMGFDAVRWLWRYLPARRRVVVPDLADRAAVRGQPNGRSRKMAYRSRH